MQKIKLSIVFRQSFKKHLMEFELHIKLLLFHTNSGTDVHVRLESPRTRAFSEAELHGKLQKNLCTPCEKTSCALNANFRQHRDSIIIGTLAQANLQTRRV